VSISIEVKIIAENGKMIDNGLNGVPVGRASLPAKTGGPAGCGGGNFLLQLRRSQVRQTR
jgi:hypothetical protein